MKTRFLTEMGMGVDVHGADNTLAAERAVFDAIHHSSLHFFRALEKTADDMEIDLKIGVPDPSSVDLQRVAKALPYGTVTITVEKGGLEIHNDEGNDSIIIANAGVVVHINYDS